MPSRRLVLAREALTSLHSDELAAVQGAAASRPHPLCAVTSLQWSYCADTTCGINCSANCHTNTCA